MSISIESKYEKVRVGNDLTLKVHRTPSGRLLGFSTQYGSLLEFPVECFGDLKEFLEDLCAESVEQAVEPEKPKALILGTPGTGKTFVSPDSGVSAESFAP